MSDTATTEPAKRSLTATKIGVVTSDKADKTRTVAVEYQQKHPKYGKFLRRQAKFHAHDEANASRAGDKVEIASCRPLSKTKTWRIVRIVEEGVRQEH
ncbi:MAG: 30S ribosomal protein S17 [Planctomycetota bacterium]